MHNTRTFREKGGFTTDTKKNKYKCGRRRRRTITKRNSNPFPICHSNFFHSQYFAQIMKQTGILNLFAVLLIFFIFHQKISAKNVQQKEAKRLKVLLFTPSMGWSHNQFLGKIADTLAEAGHEVHFLKLMVNPEFSSRNETSKVHQVHRMWPKHLTTPEELAIAQKMSSNSDSFSGQHFNTFHFMDAGFSQLQNVVVDSCRALIESTEILDELANEQFDVAIAEIYDPCPFAAFHRMGIRKTIGASALPLIQPFTRGFGLPTFASFMPDFSNPSMNGPMGMTFMERIINFYNIFYIWFSWEDQFNSLEMKLIESAFGPGFPSAKELIGNISVVLVNSNPFMEFPAPTSNKMVYIGGLVDDNAAKDIHKIDPNILRILDNSNGGGAVLVSFGSVADTRAIGANMLRAMLQAFAHFPEVQFIWKFHNQTEGERKAGGAFPANVHTFQWLNQMAILSHPNLRAFVTHCGRNSLNEAANAGVPLVTIPLFADQLYNAALAKHKGIGVYVDVRKLNEHSGQNVMIQELGKVLNDKSFQRNAQLIGAKLRESPLPSPPEQVVRWVEFAAKFPPLEELNLPRDEDLGWFLYYSLDVILFTLALLLLLASIAVVLLLKIVQIVFSNSKRILEMYNIDKKIN